MQHFSTDTLQRIGARVNNGRKGKDSVLLLFAFRETDAGIRDLPGFTFSVGCGEHNKTHFDQGVCYFRCIGDMEEGIAGILERHFQVAQHSELKLAQGDADDGPAYERDLTMSEIHEEARIVGAASRDGDPDGGLIGVLQQVAEAPKCPICGHEAVKNGACYKCLNCGEAMGCS
jgi:hypothetical protein